MRKRKLPLFLGAILMSSSLFFYSKLNVYFFFFLASLEPIKTPTEFFNALAKPRRGDLSSISTLLGEEASWSSLDELSREKLKKAGVTIKERK